MRFLGEGSAFECCHWADANLITEGKLSILTPCPWKATVNKKHSAIRCQGLIWSAAKYVTNHWQEVSPEGNKEKEVTVLEAALVGVPVRDWEGSHCQPWLPREVLPAWQVSHLEFVTHFPMVQGNLHRTGKSTREIPKTIKSPVTKKEKKKKLVSQFISRKIEEIWKLMQIKVKREMIS